MKKILSLCINLLLLIISDAVPLKLIAGDRSVVKKDGATHTISKYYVVPNDYNSNNVTNTTVAIPKTTLRMHSIYAKSANSGSIVEGNSESKATTVNDQSDSDVTIEKINTQVNLRGNLNVGQGEVTNQADDSTTSTASMITEANLDFDDLGKLQVKPILIPNYRDSDKEVAMNVSSGETLQNGIANAVENVTHYQTQRTFVDNSDKLHGLILSKFGKEVNQSYSHNLESFWKLIKLNIDRKTNDDELLAAAERFSLLLNIFTYLYEAAQVQKPIETMINGIIEILQNPFVEKSAEDESQAETNVSGDYDEECLKKCGRRSSKPQLDSHGTYLSETEGRQSSDSIEVENLQRRHRGYTDDKYIIKIFNEPDSNRVTVKNEPANVLRSQLLVPQNVGVPDGLNVLLSRIQTKPNLNQTTETVENPDDQLVKGEPRVTDILPMTTESRTTDNLPWHIEDKTTEYFSWPETTPTDDLPWHIEDKKSAHNPFNIEQRISNKIPWIVKSRTDPTWIIENKRGHLPITTTKLHSIQNGGQKPYHIYTYVINPTTTSYDVPNSGKIVQVIPEQLNDYLGATLYGLPNQAGGKKVAYLNQPLKSHYESKYGLPTIDISSQPSHSQATHTNYITTSYESRHEVNPSALYPQTLQEDIKPKHLVGYGTESNRIPALQLNTYTSESESYSSEEIEAPTVSETDSVPGALLMNIHPSESLPSLSNTGLDNSASSSIVDTNNVNLDIEDQYLKPNTYNPYDNGNLIQQSSQPPLITMASAHSSVQTSQYPGNILNGPKNPVYGEQIHLEPGATATASAHSKYTDVKHDHNVPISGYGTDTNNHPGFISNANGPNNSTNFAPNNGQNQNTRPGLISAVHQYPVYPNVVNDFDDSIPVGVQNHPYEISQDSTIPNNYNVPTYDYEDDTDILPGEIQNVPDYPEYTNQVKHNGNSRPMQNGDNYSVLYRPYGHTVHDIYQPSFIQHIPGKQNLKLKLAPTYRLFTLQNLQNLEYAIIKTIQMHEPVVYDRALINLKKIIHCILILAKNLDETDGTKAWYENIFYNSQHRQHPLQIYVYNVIRQRWLHELILLLYKNNFSINILQNPGIFSFLESWQFPKYVQNFMEAEEHKHVPSPQDNGDITYNQNDLQDKFSSQTYDDLLQEVPQDIEKYVTKNVIDSYKAPNDGIVLSIAGVEAEPDANAIIDILQNYLQNKNYIETQQDVIIRDNKVEMLKQIILFLREKGYAPNTIADLVRKLYSAVYSTEGKGCNPHHTNFTKHMYDVILPVLRRSGR